MGYRPARSVNRHPIGCSVCGEIIVKNECISSYMAIVSHKRCETGLVEKVNLHRQNRGMLPLGEHALCSFEGCERKSRTLTLCDGHYQQRRHGKDLTPIV